jgi:site-specific recombinase XerC
MLVKRRHSRPIPDAAEIFEKDGRRYARWTSASGRTKCRPLNRKGDRMVEESRRWYVRLRDPGTGRWREWKAYHDRQASHALEIDILRRIERGEAGLIDPAAAHRKTPLDAHLLAFESHLEDKGNTQDHIDKTLSRCRRIIQQIDANVAADITAESVDAALAGFRRGGMSRSTSNGYFRAMRTLCRWMLRTGRIVVNPLVGMSCINVTDADRRRKRRPLTDVEAKALIETTRTSPESFMGLSGPDRAMLYLVAINTGLRASELASLTPESFELGDDRSLVRCQAGYTKNGQEAELPLRRDVAARVRTWLASKPAAEPVWPGKWAAQRHGAEMIRIDLTAADIEAEDDRGRVVDFHALRHTFISNLARAGVHPRNAQALARHSTIDLTMNVYTHITMDDMAKDIETLPSLQATGLAGDSSNDERDVAGNALDHAVESAMPDELSGLMENWGSLPDHIRSAISTLAGV